MIGKKMTARVEGEPKCCRRAIGSWWKRTRRRLGRLQVGSTLLPASRPTGLLCLLAALLTGPLLADESTKAEREAQEIMQRVRTTRPPENSSVEGAFKVFHGRRLHAVIPFRSEVLVTATNWQVTYQTLPSTNSLPQEKLIVIRDANSGLQYCSSVTTNSPKATAFSGSDFLAADLGLDFLNWPKQRLLKKELRSSQSCHVIESTNPSTNSLPYSRVVTWLDIDSVRDFGAPAIVHADAYDARGKLLKEFEPKEFKKVDGQWQVEELQIENVQTGTKTKIEFHFDRN